MKLVARLAVALVLGLNAATTAAVPINFVEAGRA